LPAAAVASSRLTYLMVKFPTLPPASVRAICSPLTTSSDCGRELLVRRRAGRSVLYGLGAVGEALLLSARAAPAPPEG
jgi:hypothetical protein